MEPTKPPTSKASDGPTSVPDAPITHGSSTLPDILTTNHSRTVPDAPTTKRNTYWVFTNLPTGGKCTSGFLEEAFLKGTCSFQGDALGVWTKEKDDSVAFSSKLDEALKGRKERARAQRSGGR